VVIFHAYQRFLTGGYAGVDIFFVISGYLITGIILREVRTSSFNVRRFYARRILRIFPALALMLPACLVTGWLILQAQDYQQLGEHTVASVLFVSNIAAFLESGYFASAAAANPLLHLWSLGVEEQFYLVWPGLLVLFLRSRLPAALMAVCFVASLAVCILSASNAAYFFSPLNRFWELLAGGALALHEARRGLDAGPSRKLADAASVLGLCLIVLAIFGLHANDPYPGWRAIVPVMGAVLLIAAGQGGLINRTFLSARPMVWIGLISYPLYIWHWPLLSFSYLQSGVWPGFWLASALVAGAVVLAVLTYWLVERPLRHAPRRRRPMAVAALVAALGLIGGFSAVLDAEGGVPQRFPPSVMALQEIGNPYQYFNLPQELRYPPCHNVPANRLTAHIPNQCIETSRPLVLLWGDSFSANLYPGLQTLQGKLHFGIAQLTSGNAPPFFTTDRYAANGLRLDVLNNQVLTAIKRLQPDVIIMAFMVDGMNAIAAPPEAFSQLMVSIGKARSVSPHTKFVVIGPYPEWGHTLTADLIDVMLSPDHPKKLPMYISTGLSKTPFEFDDYFRAAFAKTGVIYISSLQNLCNRRGCLARTGPELSDLTAVDFGHLTSAGSNYLVSKIAGDVPILDGKGN
jgi:peptidoglycan/LPS O-acetylase OafA/YrhL